MTSNNNLDINLMLDNSKSIYNLPIKISFFIFMVYLFVSSDIWINMLSKWNIIDKNLNIMNQKAYIFNGIIMSISFLLIYFLIEKEIL